MPKLHLSVREALEHYSEERLWNDQSLNELMTQYIEENCSSEDFSEFLKKKAEEESTEEFLDTMKE